MISGQLPSYCIWACNPAAASAVCEYLWQHGKTGDHHGVTAGYRPSSFLVLSLCLLPSLYVSLPSFSFSQAVLLSAHLHILLPTAFLCLSLSFKQLVVWTRASEKSITFPLCFLSCVRHFKRILNDADNFCATAMKGERHKNSSLKIDYSWILRKFYWL